MDCFHLELAIKAQVAHPTPRRAIKKWVLFLGELYLKLHKTFDGASCHC